MNNIRNNVPKQNTETNLSPKDMYKSLKDITKEIEKIYKKLSKDESFPEILDIIKKEFINNNISNIENYLSNTKVSDYKNFNPKIIKILEILINILENFTYFKDKDNVKTLNGIADDIIKAIKDRVVVDNTPVAGGTAADKRLTRPAANLSKYIEECITAQGIVEGDSGQKYETYKNAAEAIKIKIDALKSNPATDKDNALKFLRYISTFKYYLDIFKNNDALGEQLDRLIADAKNELATLESKNVDAGKTQQSKINAKNEELRKLHEDNKSIYRELINYIKLETHNIFKIVEEEAEAIKKGGDDKKDEKKGGEKEYQKHVENFKTAIYYEIININNTPSTDHYARINDNNNEKIELNDRKKLLATMKDLLDKQLSKLKSIIDDLIATNKQEYIEQIKEIRKIFKDYEKEKEYKDSITTLIVAEEAEIEKLLAINAEQSKTLNSIKQVGGEKKSNKYYEDKYKAIDDLNNKIEDLKKIIKENEGIEDDGDPFEKKGNSMMLNANDGIISIYKNIWNDYLKETKKSGAKGITIDNLKQDDRLYQRFNANNLDPFEVLKVSFQDKIIFICIILIIRTFAMVLIEFLIEYNIISTLYRGILVYSLLYILLIILSVIVINYDSYKLRIIVNYLNLHINSSNIYFHIMLFVIFIMLILIIINNNENSLNSIDNIFNYTYIYKYIYEIAEKSKDTSDLRLSQKEKMKLQYRMDIITMIVFIFSSLLILIM
uniref:Uncharacterized protein n=1 Tax=viral metagenome TaxID=1070528 RepID=A0A6C0IB49_9ZZZZ